MIEKNMVYQTSNFAVLSVSYEKANTTIRGKFAFFEEYTAEFVRQIKERHMGDAFVVSTCNRTEIYTTTHNYMFVAQLFCNILGVALVDFIKYCEVYKGEDALNHLFRVAGGLESQILGDFEIISQIKKSYARFKAYKRKTNSYLERAINIAIQVSKRIKNETQLSNGAASVSYAAVHHILNTQKSFSDKNILLLGLGEIGQNTLENLIKHIISPKIKVINRTKEKAELVARKFNVLSADFSHLREEVEQADILIVATGAPQSILHRDDFVVNKPKLVLDLSIPHNVDKSVGELPYIELVDVDLLSTHIEKTMDLRRKEIPNAEEIIKEMIREFLNWERKRRFTPHIYQFKSILNRIEQNEMHHFYRKHRYIGIEDMELSQKIIQKITNRFAKFVIENPMRADEISKLMDEIFVKQPREEFNEKHN